MNKMKFNENINVNIKQYNYRFYFIMTEFVKTIESKYVIYNVFK